jgi:PTH1 family peptidyl-tRNA hydrolase
LRLIVGLGNPGREYADTRHNVGFMVLDEISRGAGVAFRSVKDWSADVLTLEGVHYCKPMSFMNRSGRPVGALCNYYKIPADEVLVVYDDAALPLGRLRLRERGSAGSHNGLQSILEHLGTTEVPRLRIGIGEGESQRGGMTSHVLGRFTTEEREELAAGVERAQEAIGMIQRQGMAAAMNHYNQQSAT